MMSRKRPLDDVEIKEESEDMPLYKQVKRWYLFNISAF